MAGVASSVPRTRTRTRPVTVTAGFTDTTRALVARHLVAALGKAGIEADLVATAGTGDELEHVERGAVDLALVSGAQRMRDFPHVRVVTPLYVEALHLLVRAELAEQVAAGFDALGGRTVDVGPPGSTNAGLTAALLDFAGLRPTSRVPDGGYVPRSLTPPELDALVARGDPAALPDAVFHLATVPSKIAAELIGSAGYNLVPLPFAEAFRLGVLLPTEVAEGAAAAVDRRQVVDAAIPAFTYGLDPPAPPGAVATIGTRLLLVANQRLPVELVERVLDVVFAAEIARVSTPPLDRSVLALPPPAALHDGAAAYLRRDMPFVTNDAVDTLSNSLSILGALAGGGLFLWQWWRQRTRSRREDTFGTYMRRVAEVERRLAALELAATLELEPLAALQRELLQLKSDALDRYADDQLGDQAALGDLLTPINAARDHIGDLILHVRDNLEERADAEGRTAARLWREAIEPPAGEATRPPAPPEPTGT